MGWQSRYSHLFNSSKISVWIIALSQSNKLKSYILQQSIFDWWRFKCFNGFGL